MLISFFQRRGSVLLSIILPFSKHYNRTSVRAEAACLKQVSKWSNLGITYRCQARQRGRVCLAALSRARYLSLDKSCRSHRASVSLPAPERNALTTEGGFRVLVSLVTGVGKDWGPGPEGSPGRLGALSRATREAARRKGAPCTQQALAEVQRRDPRGRPAPSPAELPVHYIQVQVVGPRVQHAQALGPQVGQVAVEDGRADLAARRHGAGSLERVSPREPGPAKTSSRLGAPHWLRPLPPRTLFRTLPEAAVLRRGSPASSWGRGCQMGGEGRAFCLRSWNFRLSRIASPFCKEKQFIEYKYKKATGPSARLPPTM